MMNDVQPVSLHAWGLVLGTSHGIQKPAWVLEMGTWGFKSPE